MRAAVACIGNLRPIAMILVLVCSLNGANQLRPKYKYKFVIVKTMMKKTMKVCDFQVFRMTDFSERSFLFGNHFNRSFLFLPLEIQNRASTE